MSQTPYSLLILRKVHNCAGQEDNAVCISFVTDVCLITSYNFFLAH